jgi:hypothetical protein
MKEIPYRRLEEATTSTSTGEQKACERKNMKRLVMPFICLLMVCIITWHSFPVFEVNYRMPVSGNISCAEPVVDTKNTTIFIITPTYPRPERLADMTRFAQTIMHVPDLIWIVVEDGEKTSEPVERLLNRTRIPYVYLKTVTKDGLPRRGWTHRNFALDYLRTVYSDYNKNAVVYFADDDNSYDIRLFNDYIRNVKTIGVWAVGLSGAAKVESPYVENGEIKRWEAVYRPDRAYAVDMAGFAVNLKLIQNSSASFGKQCIGHDPEDCFLQQFKIPKKDAQPFGWDSKPKEILVWHTRTSSGSTNGEDHGYVFEAKKEAPPKPKTNSTG